MPRRTLLGAGILRYDFIAQRERFSNEPARRVGRGARSCTSSQAVKLPPCEGVRQKPTISFRQRGRPLHCAPAPHGLVVSPRGAKTVTDCAECCAATVASIQF